jgi:hypothetical protein
MPADAGHIRHNRYGGAGVHRDMDRQRRRWILEYGKQLVSGPGSADDRCRMRRRTIAWVFRPHAGALVLWRRNAAWAVGRWGLPSDAWGLLLVAGNPDCELADDLSPGRELDL